MQKLAFKDLTHNPQLSKEEATSLTAPIFLVELMEAFMAMKKGKSQVGMEFILNYTSLSGMS